MQARSTHYLKHGQDQDGEACVFDARAHAGMYESVLMYMLLSHIVYFHAAYGRAGVRAGEARIKLCAERKNKGTGSHALARARMFGG
jgi:hypothetical protein